jgi:hypothetical protein
MKAEGENEGLPGGLKCLPWVPLLLNHARGGYRNHSPGVYFNSDHFALITSHFILNYNIVIICILQKKYMRLKKSSEFVPHHTAGFDSTSLALFVCVSLDDTLKRPETHARSSSIMWMVPTRGS